MKRLIKIILIILAAVFGTGFLKITSQFHQVK